MKPTLKDTFKDQVEIHFNEMTHWWFFGRQPAGDAMTRSDDLTWPDIMSRWRDVMTCPDQAWPDLNWPCETMTQCNDLTWPDLVARWLVLMTWLYLTSWCDDPMWWPDLTLWCYDRMWWNKIHWPCKYTVCNRTCNRTCKNTSEEKLLEAWPTHGPTNERG